MKRLTVAMCQNWGRLNLNGRNSGAIVSQASKQVLWQNVGTQTGALGAFASVRQLSTEAALKEKIETTPSLKEILMDEEEHLKRIGLIREKIEVDGIHLNWDKMGRGDHVVLLLPGIIGKIINWKS